MAIRATKVAWTPERIENLRGLIQQGLSVSRISVVLKRPSQSIRNKARELGMPLPTIQEIRRRQLEKEQR